MSYVYFHTSIGIKSWIDSFVVGPGMAGRGKRSASREIIVVDSGMGVDNQAFDFLMSCTGKVLLFAPDGETSNFEEILKLNGSCQFRRIRNAEFERLVADYSVDEVHIFCRE